MFAEPSDDELDEDQKKREYIVINEISYTSWYHEIYLITKKDQNAADSKNGMMVAFRQIQICGKKFKKTRQRWEIDHVQAQDQHFKATINYDLYGDVHQVANYCEIMWKQDKDCVAK